MLKYEDVSKLEGLGWIEYNIPINIGNFSSLIKVNGSNINMVYFLFHLFSLISR